MRKFWEDLPIELKAAIVIPALMAWAVLIIGISVLGIALAFKIAGLQ